MHGFDIYFAGEIAAGQNLAEVKARIGRAFRLSDDKLDALFCGKPVQIKANIKAEEAGKYRRVFRDAGGLVDIVPTGSKPQGSESSPASASQPEPASAGIQLLPANTGSLIDTAKPVAEFDLSSADHLSLLPADKIPPGNSVAEFDLSSADHLSLLPADKIPPDNSNEPSFDWENVSQIEVLPANTGSLEDCAEEGKPVPIPDISGMKLVD